MSPFRKEWGAYWEKERDKERLQIYVGHVLLKMKSPRPRSAWVILHLKPRHRLHCILSLTLSVLLGFHASSSSGWKARDSFIFKIRGGGGVVRIGARVSSPHLLSVIQSSLRSSPQGCWAWHIFTGRGCFLETVQDSLTPYPALCTYTTSALCMILPILLPAPERGSTPWSTVPLPLCVDS